MVMLAGGATAILGGAFLWRGWLRYHDCVDVPPEPYAVCEPFNAPFTTGLVLAPVGVLTFVVGGAVALIQIGEG
jgi:hypothetical protein